MTVIHIEATVTEDRRLIIELPPDTPLGEVHVTIQPAGELTREEARRLMAEAGILAPPSDLPPDFVPPTEEERMELARQMAKGRPSIDLLNDDRGEY